jgi:hypothetical protein
MTYDMMKLLVLAYSIVGVLIYAYMHDVHHYTFNITKWKHWIVLLFFGPCIWLIGFLFLSVNLIDGIGYAVSKWLDD